MGYTHLLQVGRTASSHVVPDVVTSTRGLDGPASAIGTPALHCAMLCTCDSDCALAAKDSAAQSVPLVPAKVLHCLIPEHVRALPYGA